ncbi:hypothetical protein A2U01_0050133 [Trifolium medium]|uniref:Uncharacterized protein n=1 Tax=Trifolium medium TaxID=97028 RepID=A0A392QZD0_9FABA|nr:hypothetical protein [Trifolium medium]
MSKNDITRYIHTADGSLMHDPWTGQLIGTGCKIGRLYELTELLPFNFGIVVLPTVQLENCAL